MSRFRALDLASLPPPEIIEQLDYEAILASAKDSFLAFWAVLRQTRPELPQYDVQDLETDEGIVVLQAFAWEAMRLRGKFNDGAKALLLPFSWGGNLDQLGALFAVQRLPGEGDERLRRRIQLAPGTYAAGGSDAGYMYQVMTVDPDVRDVLVDQRKPGHVNVIVMAEGNDPRPSADRLRAIRDHLYRADIRTTDVVDVVAPRVVATAVKARLTLYPGADAGLTVAAATTALAAFTDWTLYLGYDLLRDAIKARLHQTGVHSVQLIEPAADIVLGKGDCYRVTAVDIKAEVRRDA